jgi:hypothetical protein
MSPPLFADWVWRFSDDCALNALVPGARIRPGPALFYNISPVRFVAKNQFAGIKQRYDFI